MTAPACFMCGAAIGLDDVGRCLDQVACKERSDAATLANNPTGITREERESAEDSDHTKHDDDALAHLVDPKKRGGS